MTVGACVYCRCYLDGKTSPPPVPVERFSLGDEGGWFRGLQVGQREDGSIAAEDFATFDTWLESCCPHPGLIAAEFDVNWGGLTWFRQALESTSPSEFSILLAHLPRSNDGWVSPEISALMRTELRMFRARSELVPGSVLIDSETGLEATGRGPAFPNDWVWLAMGPGYEPGTLQVGYDEAGLYLRSSDRGEAAGTEVFRARRVEIRPSSTDHSARVPPKSAEYIDRESGRTAIGPSFIFADSPWPASADGARRTRLVHVEQRMVLSSEFGYVVDGLEAVCAASIALGQPLFWT